MNTEVRLPHSCSQPWESGIGQETLTAIPHETVATCQGILYAPHNYIIKTQLRDFTVNIIHVTSVSPALRSTDVLWFVAGS